MMLLAGLITISIVGIIVHAPYGVGLLPVYFIVWIFVPFAVFGSFLNLAIRWDGLWRIVALGAIAMSAAMFALGGFRVAFWLVIVPAGGLLVATLPNVMVPPRDEVD